MLKLGKSGAALLVLAAIPLFLFFGYVPSNSFPSEDAAMLFQYSENLAEGGRIAYNLNGPPVEGATDFLWMLFLSLCHRVGFDTYLAACVLSAVALLMSAYLLVRLSQRRQPSLFLLAVLALMAIPQVFAAIQGFSPFFFGLFILLSMVAFVEERAKTTFFAAILTCLVRPDGVVFAVPLVAAYLLRHRAELKQNLLRVLLIAVVPGIAYFAWRFTYFDSLFPLPFYVKSNFERVAILFNIYSLKLNLMFMVALLPMFIWAALGMRWADRKMQTTAILVALTLVAVPFIFYSSMQLEQNLAYRFQYPFVLIALALTALALRYTPPSPMAGVAVLCSLVLMGPWYAVEGIRTLSMPCENIPYVSQAIGSLPCRGRIATTEAGRFPYYSDWETIDLWGLNTTELAQTLVTPEDVQRYNPDLVVIHPLGGHYGDDYRFLREADLPVHTNRSWGNMVENVYSGTRPGDYKLLMVPHMVAHETGNPLVWVPRVRQYLEDRLGYVGSFDTYYAFFIRRDSDCYQPLTELVADYGAITLDEYEEKKQAFIEEHP